MWLKKMLTPDVGFVSVALVNHELGYIQPIEEIAEIVKAERLRRQENGESLPLIFHTDASQAAALIDVKIKRLGVDLLTLSAAKVYGPKQVGLLWVRPGVTLKPIFLVVVKSWGYVAELKTLLAWLGSRLLWNWRKNDVLLK